MSASTAAPAVDRLHPVVCVVDRRHRDVGVADDARQGRFTHAGMTLAPGRRPNWIDDGVTADVEWRIEWVKLYVGLDLGHAYALTGDVDHLHTWEDLVESFCAQVPVGHDPSDVSARRLQNWMYAWQRFAAVDRFPGLRRGLASVLCRRIRVDLDHLAAHLTAERNHRTLELYTLLLGGLALDDRPLAERAITLLADNAATDVLPDGVHRERSSDYHLVVLRSLVGAIANARDAELSVPPALLERTGRASTFALHLQRPDGTTPALSDGDEGDYRDLLELAGEVLDRPELTWAATAGRAGRPPSERHVTFPVGGYAVQRSGWGQHRDAGREHWAIIDVGPVGDGGHGHYDHLSVELAAGGHRIVVDPGRYTYADDGAGWRRWFKGTAAHNTVCIDGLDQTAYRRGKPAGRVSTASIVARNRVDGLDVVRGRAISPRYRAEHSRALGFVADDYWVVHDLIEDDTAHDCVARWHLDSPALDHVTIEDRDGGAIVTTPTSTIAIAGDHPRVELESGWISPTYGIKVPAPVIAVHARRSTRVELFTVVAAGHRRVQFRDVRNSGTHETVEIEVDIGPWTDRIRWNDDVTHVGWERRPC